MSFATRQIDTRGLRDLAPFVMDDEGMPRVMPASFYAATSIEERAWLGIRFGLYCLPTDELCDWLRDRIGSRPAIEIGSGNGVLAQRVGIPATDNHLQQDPAIQAYYRLLGQPLIRYGDQVEQLEASEAIAKYRPAVVVGAWVSHRYDPRAHSRGGNEHGPDTDAILATCDEYVLIGNEGTHAQHPLLDKPHELFHFPWLYSRAFSGRPDFIGVWKGSGGR